MIANGAVSLVLASARAMPKSVIATRPSVRTIRLDGLMSRCTMSRWCAACSASRAPATSSRVRSTVMGPEFASTRSSGLPSISSMTM